MFLNNDFEKEFSAHRPLEIKQKKRKEMSIKGQPPGVCELLKQARR
jgi:hypothetical protein